MNVKREHMLELLFSTQIEANVQNVGLYLHALKSSRRGKGKRWLWLFVFLAPVLKEAPQRLCKSLLANYNIIISHFIEVNSE